MLMNPLNNQVIADGYCVICHAKINKSISILGLCDICLSAENKAKEIISKSENQIKEKNIGKKNKNIRKIDKST